MKCIMNGVEAMDGNFVVYKRRNNYYETDQMGIIHHSNYIRFFEEARLYMMKEFDLDYAGLEEMGIIIPVMSVDCKYIKPLHYDEQIDIYTKITKFDGIKMDVEYEIYRDGELCTTGKSGHCFLDKQLKPFRMKKLYPDLYEKLNSIL